MMRIMAISMNNTVKLWWFDNHAQENSGFKLKKLKDEE
jgi:hypothetical protein